MSLTTAFSKARTKVREWIITVCPSTTLETLEICLDIDQLNQWLASKADIQHSDLIFAEEAFGDLE